jgi:hypothetical protein
MSNPAFRIPTVSQSLDEEHNLHIWEKVCLIKSRFSRRFCTSAHISGQLLIFQGKTCSLDRALTRSLTAAIPYCRIMFFAHQCGVIQLRSASFTVGIDMINCEILPGQNLATDSAFTILGSIPQDAPQAHGIAVGDYGVAGVGQD